MPNPHPSKPDQLKSYKLKEYGQVRTLADIVKYLNEQSQYTSLHDLLEDFHLVLAMYKKRGTISVETYDLMQEVFLENEQSLFEEGKLNIARLEEILNNKELVLDKIEQIFYKRTTAKLLHILQYLNTKRQYISPGQVINDLERLIKHPNRVLNDTYHYPLFYFEKGLTTQWSIITKDGILNNELLEEHMFAIHEERLKLYGLNQVITMDYEDDGPCHPEVYFPLVDGLAPVYVKTDDNTFMKSCGEGKGPNGIPDFYEELLLSILRESDNESAS